MFRGQPLTAPCRKCRAEMIYVTSLPHPQAPEVMQRTTFLCSVCNQTKSYSLSVEMARAYAAANFGQIETDCPLPIGR
jgi:hypothetical protein